jgi:single-strand DNA-binding protein
MINKVIMVGRLTADPEMRFTVDGKAVTNARIAVDSGYGEKKKSDFFRCVMFGKSAEFAGEYLKKGYMVYIEGRITNKEYEKDGEKRFTTEIIVNEVKNLQQKGTKETVEEQDTHDDIPF